MKTLRNILGITLPIVLGCGGLVNSFTEPRQATYDSDPRLVIIEQPKVGEAYMIGIMRFCGHEEGIGMRDFKLVNGEISLYEDGQKIEINSGFAISLVAFSNGGINLLNSENITHDTPGPHVYTLEGVDPKGYSYFDQLQIEVTE